MVVTVVSVFPELALGCASGDLDRPLRRAGRAPPPGGWAAGVARRAPSLHPNRAARGIRAPLSGDATPGAQSRGRERRRVPPLVGRGDAPRIGAADSPCLRGVSCSVCRFPHRLALHADSRAGKRALLRYDGGGEGSSPTLFYSPSATRLLASLYMHPSPPATAQAGCDGRLLLEAQDPGTLAVRVDALEGAFVRFALDLTQQLAPRLAGPAATAATAVGATSAARRDGEIVTASQAAAAAAATAASALAQATLTRVAAKAVTVLQRLTSEYRRGGSESRGAAAAAAPRLSQAQAQAASSSSSSTEASAPPGSTAAAPAEYPAEDRHRQCIPVPATILCLKSNLAAELAILEPDIRAACGSQPSRRKLGAYLDYAGSMVLVRMVLRHVDPSIVVLPQDVPGSRHGASDIAHFKLAFSAASGSATTGSASTDPRRIIDAHTGAPARRIDRPEQEPPAPGLQYASTGTASRKITLPAPASVVAATGTRMATDTRTPTGPARVRVTSDSNGGLSGARWQVGVSRHSTTGRSTSSSASSPTGSASATGTGGDAQAPSQALLVCLGGASGAGARAMQPAATLALAVPVATVPVSPSPTTTWVQVASGSSSPTAPAAVAVALPVPVAASGSSLAPLPLALSRHWQAKLCSVVPGSLATASASAACPSRLLSPGPRLPVSLSLSAALTASSDGTDKAPAHALAVLGPGRLGLGGSGVLTGTGMQTRSAAAKLRVGVGRSTLERDAHVPRITGTGPDIICHWQWPVGSAGSGNAVLAPPALAFDDAHIRAQAASADAHAQARRRAPRTPASATPSQAGSGGGKDAGSLRLAVAQAARGPLVHTTAVGPLALACVVMSGRSCGESEPQSPARAQTWESESVPLPRPHWHSPARAASASESKSAGHYPGPGDSEPDSDSESDSLRVSASESRGATDSASLSARATDLDPLGRGSLSLPASDADAQCQWVQSLRVDAQLLLQGYLPSDDLGTGSICDHDSIANAGPFAASLSVSPARLHEGDEAGPGHACGGASVLPVAGGMPVPVENGASICLALGPPSRYWQATTSTAPRPGDTLLRAGAPAPAAAPAVPAASVSHGATASLCEVGVLRLPVPLALAERRGDSASDVTRAGEAAFLAATAASATASQYIVDISFEDDGEQSKDSDSVRHQPPPPPMMQRTQSAAGAIQPEAVAVAQSGLGRAGGEGGGRGTSAPATCPLACADSEAGRARVALLMLPPHHENGPSDAASSGDGGDAESDVGWEPTT